MKGFFSNKTTVTTTHIMGKSDKKKFNTQLTKQFSDANLSTEGHGLLDIKKEYKIICLNNRAKIIKLEGSSMYFQYFDNTFPTIQNFDKDIYKVIKLDQGAAGPLLRGAEVMAPGVLKFGEINDNFEKDQVVGIEIEGMGIFAVGITLVSSIEMKKTKQGPVIDIIHIKDDELYKNNY